MNAVKHITSTRQKTALTHRSVDTARKITQLQTAQTYRNHHPVLPVIRTIRHTAINIRSLQTHKSVFEQLLREEHVTAFALNETFLTPRQSIRIPRYALIRSDCPQHIVRAQGGTAIGYYSTIPTQSHALPPQLHLPGHSIVTIYSKARAITFCTIYVRPGHPIPYEFFQYIDNHFRHYLIMADINFHSRSNADKQQFRQYINTILNAKFHDLPLPSRPISNTSPDVVISSSSLTVANLRVLPPFGSDHAPILLDIAAPNNKKQNNQIIKHFDYATADWTSYQTEITESLQDHREPQTERELYSIIDNITSAIDHATKNNIPLKTRQPHKPPVPPQYLPIISASRRAFRDYIQTRNPESLRQHRRWNRMISNYLDAYKRRRWIKTCNHLSTMSHPTKFWTKFHQLTGKYQRTTYPLISDDQPLTTDEEKANAFADFFQTILTPTITPYRTALHSRIEHLYTNQPPHLQPNIHHHLQDTLLTSPITSNEIQSVIHSKRNTAPGFDNITYKLIKSSPQIVHTLLATVYNFILRTGYYPQNWKVSKTLLFIKPNKPPSNISSYRPIQLTSRFSKIFEKILVRRLQEHLNEHHLLPIHQAGFRPQISTLDQLLRLSNAITTQYNTSKPSCLLLFDLEKAFDIVWHAGLIYKLHSFNIPDSYIRLILSFLSARLTYININSTLSHPIFLHCGVPQGSVLSPLLYIMYVSDMSQLPPQISLYQYADDTAFLTTGHTIHSINTTLQPAVNAFTNWCTKWKLTINAQKTQALIILPPRCRSRIRRNPNLFQIKVNETPVRHHPQATYLGVILDTKLSWKPHMQKIRKQATQRLNLLKRLVGTSWGLHTQTVIKTYKVFIRPALTYGHTSWIAAPNDLYERLAISERHALRLA